MSSEKQIHANKENAQLGGVKTEDGKAISRMNAMKHSFFSQIVNEYDKVQHREFCEDFYNHFAPRDIFESQLVEIMLSTFLSFRRICLVENRAFIGGMKSEKMTLPSLMGVDDMVLEGLFAKDFPDQLLKYSLYKNSAFNLITKTHQELERLRGKAITPFF